MTLDDLAPIPGHVDGRAQGGFSTEVWNHATVQEYLAALASPYGWIGGINRTAERDRILEEELRAHGRDAAGVAEFIINKAGRWLDDSTLPDELPGRFRLKARRAVKPRAPPASRETILPREADLASADPWLILPDLRDFLGRRVRVTIEEV